MVEAESAAGRSPHAGLRSWSAVLASLESGVERLRRRAPELALIGFGIFLRLTALRTYQWEYSYDYGAHADAVTWWEQHFRMPPLTYSRCSYHPQLFYALGGLLKRWTGSMTSVQAMSTLFGCIRLLVAWWAAERYLRSDRIARLVALALFVGMPVSVEMDATVTQESLNNLVGLWFVIRLMKFCAAPDAKRWRSALALGLVTGLGLLTKVSDLLLVALVGVTALLELVQRRDLSAPKRIGRLGAWLLAAGVALAISAPQFIYNQQVYGKAIMDGWYKSPTADTTSVGSDRLELLDRRTLGFAFGFTPDIVSYPYFPVGIGPTPRFWSILIASSFCDYYNFCFAPQFDAGGFVPVRMNPTRTNAGGRATAWARASVASGIGIALFALVGWLVAVPRLLARREVARPAALLLPALGVCGALYFAIQFPYDFEGVIKGHYFHFVTPPLYAVFGLGVARLVRSRLFAPIGWLGVALVIAPTVYSTLCVLR